ncbi:hypothetical protein OS493_006003 [Desmophyllum pertusum]|uniref:Homeobox domain-containing protein n=1 Tax=Desmophyllum pertusum TaxID=174260 RepID=A0A9W9YHA7_9CNID|nr:hypothetical protein OS493_006003 [Desmophyllum pertusum]
MQCQHFKSVVTSDSSSVMISPLRVVSPSPPPLRPSSLAPVPRKSLSFSISKILGLEEDVTTSEYSPNSVIVESRTASRRCSDISPRSSPYSENSSSTSDSEPDQVSTHYEQPPRKKRQRTTFSPIEVWELEGAFKRSPCLSSKDEEELVQRLGIMVKSLEHWFQNRRAKLRKEERYTESVYQTNPSDQFDRLQSRHHSEEPQADQAQIERGYYTALFHRLEDQPCRKHKPVLTRNHYSSFQSSQFRTSSRPLVAILHQNQFQLRPAGLVKLPLSRGFHRYQPY